MKPTELEKYCEFFSSKESPFLEKIRVKTAEFYSAKYPNDPNRPPSPGGYPGGKMISGPQVVGFIQFLMRIQGASKILDIGTYTGYSAIAMAEVLAELESKSGIKGSIVTLEKSREALDLATSFFNKTSLGGYIQPLLGEAKKLLSLPELDQQYFDLVFIDADKGSSLEYVDWALKHLTPRGVIIVDDVLWYGQVSEGANGSATLDKRAGAMHRLNEHLSKNPLIYHQLLPIRHGLQVITLRFLEVAR